MGISEKEFPITDQIKIEITTAKSVMVFLQAWLGKKGENLNLRSKNATEEAYKERESCKQTYTSWIKVEKDKSILNLP
jgi:hypothetical protein